MDAIVAKAPAPRTRAKVKAVAKAVAPSGPIEIPEPTAVTTLAMSQGGARREREDVPLRKEEEKQGKDPNQLLSCPGVVR